jgi:hypothetical protein
LNGVDADQTAPAPSQPPRGICFKEHCSRTRDRKPPSSGGGRIRGFPAKPWPRRR